MKLYLISSVISLALSVVTGVIFLPLLRKLKAGQPILKYVKTHKDKNGTPTMGGLFFIIPSLIVFLFACGAESRIAVVCAVIGAAYMTVGLIDDYLKIKYKENQGLKAYQKIVFQGAIAIFAGVFAYVNGITVMHVPFTTAHVDTNIFTIPIVAIVFIAITNSVNLTDGLDGLASGVSVMYLLFLVFLITLQVKTLNFMYLKVEEYQNLNLLSATLIGGLLGFLCFNTSKAKVFMGDTGSLGLGGFIGAISIFSSNTMFIPILGIMFVTSSISVIMQVLRFKRTGKRIFLMAPLHHHFQMKGVSESKISYVYSLITALFGALSLLIYA